MFPTFLFLSLFLHSLLHLFILFFLLQIGLIIHQVRTHFLDPEKMAMSDKKKEQLVTVNFNLVYLPSLLYVLFLHLLPPSLPAPFPPLLCPPMLSSSPPSPLLPSLPSPLSLPSFYLLSSPPPPFPPLACSIVFFFI